MMICLTGTPGTGKSTVADLLRSRGFKLLNFHDLSRKCITGKENGEIIIDERCLGKVKVDGIVESHLSHFMQCDIVIVLRSHLRDIERRLKARNYNGKKIMDNLEAESIDLIGNEAREIHGKKVYEVLNQDLRETIELIIQIMDGKEIEHRIYDLSEEILHWY